MGPISGTETEGSDWSISCQRKRGSWSKHGAKTRSGGSHEQTERLLAPHSRADVMLQIYGIFNTESIGFIQTEHTHVYRCSLLISNANINTWKAKLFPSLTGSLKHNSFKHLHGRSRCHLPSAEQGQQSHTMKPQFRIPPFTRSGLNKTLFWNAGSRIELKSSYSMF